MLSKGLTIASICIFTSKLPFQNSIMSKQQSATLPNSQEQSTISAIWDKMLPLSWLAIFILMTVMSFKYGISGDEVDMNEYGKAILKYFTSFGSDQTVFNMPKEFDRDGVIQYYGGFFDLLCAIVNKFSPLEEYTTRHILNAWAGFVAIFFASKITGKLLGKQAAVFCSWLMFLSPFFLGHAMNNPKDVPFATAYIAAIYFTINFFEHLPKPKIKDYIALILSFGITIDIRVGGILLIPYLFVFAAIWYIIKSWFQSETVEIKNFLKPLGIAAILGYLAGSIFWPYGQKNPISNPLTALSEMSNFKVSILQLYEGTKVPSSELPGNYLIKTFSMTNTYAVLIGLILGFVLVFGQFKKKYAPTLLFILFTGLFPIVYIMYSKANVYHSWRHVTFAFPSLAIFATFGWHALSERLNASKFKYGMAIAAITLLEPIYFISSSFPNTVCYYNQLAGGVKGAYTNYEMDYYYNSVKQCVDWFKTSELPKVKQGDSVTIASNAAHLLLQYFKDNKNVKIAYVRYPERNQKNWDYSIFHIALIPDQEIKAKTWISKSVLFESQIDGCGLSALSKRPSYDDIKGFEALQANKVDTALNYFNSYLKVDPNNVSMLNIMANIYHQMQRDDIASQYNNQLNKLLQEAE